MVAIQNIILAVVAGSVMVEGGLLGAMLGGKRDLEIRGTNNIWVRSTDPAIAAAFKGCAAAIQKAGKKPHVEKKPDNIAFISEFPAICGTEAKAYKPTNGMTVAVSANTITLHNAPDSVIDALDG
ncbi:hypothetical protein OIDMADRAFT_145636 [Oidiodendron maius Zn]|uniref:Uncharacterized protein n=1 Tax=Oidiodendron maius (strain Zn) TaxID=913774 RepID=A0A0C3DDV4_OIDMZ|nr:hypothetical protein OIDMADRAFT_145636 [Oidiodendron maius Zn]